MRALVVGATSWGCTLALQLDRAGATAVVLCRDRAEAARLDAERENHRLLPGIPLPDSLLFTHDPAAAGPVDAAILAVPMQRLRDNMAAVLALPGALPPLVNAAKGLELGSHLRGSQIIAQELARDGREAPICALSGPNIAREIALGQASTTVLAGPSPAIIEPIRDMLMTPAFRVYTNDDVVGVELGGALKNIVAIGSGIGDALNAGANGRAAFLTRGLAEMARLGVAEGAQPMTFAGLAGLGDLIATAISPRSPQPLRRRAAGPRQAAGGDPRRHGARRRGGRDDPRRPSARPPRRRRDAHRRGDVPSPLRGPAPARRHPRPHDAQRPGRVGRAAGHARAVIGRGACRSGGRRSGSIAVQLEMFA